jgi:hypothetical protein
MYRRLDDVDLELRRMIEVQGRSRLQDYAGMSDAQLREILACVCGVQGELGQPGYVLTPDNLLKIMMIITRVQANIPVVIMGETGQQSFSMRALRRHMRSNTLLLLSRVWQDVARQVRRWCYGRRAEGPRRARWAERSGYHGLREGV